MINEFTILPGNQVHIPNSKYPFPDGDGSTGDEGGCNGDDDDMEDDTTVTGKRCYLTNPALELPTQPSVLFIVFFL